MIQQKFPHYKSSSDMLDWFQTFPINPEAQDLTQFPTPLGINVLNFIKPFLQNFYPGHATHTSTIPQQPICNSFNNLLQNMILQKPQFLFDIIYQNTSNTSSFNSNISSELLLFTFKNILSNFTTVLFTSLNYKKIFHSHYFLPPHYISQRAHIAINLARLHLFLHNKYQTINYTQFYLDLDLKPIRLSLHFDTIHHNSNSILLEIKHDSKYNIYITFNIDPQYFLQTFRIPSFKTYCAPLDVWFTKFYNIYKKQFSYINQQKVYNYIKFQTIIFLSNNLKQLLPNSYQPTSINSLQECTDISIKAALYHLHTCTNSTCNILSNNTAHTFYNLTSFFFKQSFTQFPTTLKYTNPNLDFSSFEPNQSLSATFFKPFPFKSLKELAHQAEQQFIQLNNTATNFKRETSFFYTFFQQFLKQAAINDNISNLNLKNALQHTFSISTNPYHFANIIAYFNIIQFSTHSISLIFSEYYQSNLPQAIKYISKKLLIPTINTDLFLSNFQIPEIPDSLFLSS